MRTLFERGHRPTQRDLSVSRSRAGAEVAPWDSSRLSLDFSGLTLQDCVGRLAQWLARLVYTE